MIEKVQTKLKLDNTILGVNIQSFHLNPNVSFNNWLIFLEYCDFFPIFNSE